jgi:ZIP family zinc transporter
MDSLESAHPVIQTALATGFTWGLTALGAASVFLTRTFDRKILDWMLGFAGGVMIAASFWSLLAPAIEMSEDQPLPVWFPAVTGFLLGGVFLRGIDMVLPHLHLNAPIEQAEGIQTAWRRAVLLVLAITLHNIPEGLAIGVAFGAAAADLPSASIAGATALALGVGIQNFPEGLGCVDALARRRHVALEEFLVRAVIRHRGAHRRGDRRGYRYSRPPDSPVCAGVCRRSHDLCRG